MTQPILKIAAVLIAISALLHLAAPFISNFSPESLQLLVFFVIYSFLAWKVWQGRRWAVWISFFVMLFFGIAGMSGFIAPQTVPAWCSLGIWIADWAAAVCLFISLWGDKPVAAISTE